MKETETVGFDYLDVLVRFPLMFVVVVLFLLSFLLLSSRDRNEEDERKVF